MDNHKHIPFKYGTITWTGNGHPSEELIQVFNLMAENALKLQDNEIPRRARIDKYTPAELAIRNAVLEIEKLDADARLTNAVMKLHEAKELVADFVDKVNPL